MKHTEELKQRRYTIKDERDVLLEMDAKSYSAEWMVTISQIFTITCLIKGSNAWTGFLSIGIFGVAFELWKHYGYDKERPWLYVGILFFIIGTALGGYCLWNI